MNNIKEYGDMAGMKVNYQKKVFTKNLISAQKMELIQLTGFQLERKVKYLRVYLTPKYSSLMKGNYMKLLQEIKNDLER